MKSFICRFLLLFILPIFFLSALSGILFFILFDILTIFFGIRGHEDLVDIYTRQVKTLVNGIDEALNRCSQ